MFDDLLLRLALGIVPLILGFTIHEAAHAFMAYKLGDRTARSQGRLTLNPVAHIDPMGSIVFPLIGLAMGGIMFGWAKPVPVDTRNFKSPRKGMFWVALAGPASNLAMAVIWALIGMGMAHVGQGEEGWLFLMAISGVQINLVLMAFNLLPLPPLDGSKMLERFLKGNALNSFRNFGAQAGILLLILVFTGILGKFYLRPILMFFSWLGYMIGLPTL